MSESNGYTKPDDLFAAEKTRRKKDVVIHGHKFCLTSWSYLDMQAFNAEDHKDDGNLHLIIGMVIDPETGESVFSKDDLSKLRGLDAGFINELVQECLQHSGLADREPEGN